MIKRGSFKFEMITNTMIVNNDYSLIDDSLVINEEKTLEEFINYINSNNIEKVGIYLDSIEILRRCPSIKYVRLGRTDAKMDFSPLYEHPEIKYFSRSMNRLSNELDYSRIPGLEFTYIYSPGRYDKNYRKIPTLKSLRLWSDKLDKGVVGEIFSSSELDCLSIDSSSLKSLEGIGNSKKMQSVILDTCRSLEDISALAEVKDTLKALSLTSCPRIKDFTVLEELENLEALILSCSTTEIPSLQFLKKLKKLKVFMFTFNVLDGDITPCKDIPYVFMMRGRKHYNLKDRDLPEEKESFTRGLDGIPSWRCLSW